MKTKFESRDLDFHGETTARSVLECGGKRSATPLFLIGRWVFDVGCSMFLVPKAVSRPPHSKTWRAGLIYFCFLLWVFSFSASAQSYSIDWHKIAGGGGASSNGQYLVSGTIGQHDASGAMSGGNYSVTGGFWSLISVVQTAGAPTLYISHSGNTVMIYWQNVSGWSLQQNSDLSVPAGWSPNNDWTTNPNGTNYLNLTSPPRNLFFRLKQ
ncbi:MAG: hypothetical protein ACREFE_00815 [Limisphaerales bacterium]